MANQPSRFMTMFKKKGKKTTTLRDRNTAQTHARTFITEKRTNKYYNSRHNIQTAKQSRTNSTGYKKPSDELTLLGIFDPQCSSTLYLFGFLTILI